MARTFRRKNVRYHFDWVFRDWERIPGTWRRKAVYVQGDEWKRRLAHYHSDSGYGDMQHKTAPHWYRRYMNKRFDRSEQTELYRYRKDAGYEVPAPRRIRNACLYW